MGVIILYSIKGSRSLYFFSPMSLLSGMTFFLTCWHDPRPLDQDLPEVVRVPDHGPPAAAEDLLAADGGDVLQGAGVGGVGAELHLAALVLGAAVHHEAQGVKHGHGHQVRHGDSRARKEEKRISP